ncbi:MAG: maleylpyruvate isomerase family mycothiol-dependent enzyme [Acidimicrobiia bacterium]|nr:maleylpyruvate isomerase family mycothiol-dependent enzyme [Acidimicrobiia bacterium]
MTAPSPTDPAAPDHAVAYRELRSRVSDLVAAIDTDTAERRAPATPDWRIKDVLAHLVGVSADVMAGNLDGAGTDAWTDVQVATRKDRTVRELLDEWDDVGSRLEEIIPAIPEGPRGQLVFDAVTHEHDLRGALDQPGARDSAALAIGFGWAADVVSMVRTGGDLGTLVLATEVGDWPAGEGPPVATVRASRFELLRAMTGRRSPAQIAALDWDDPTGLEPDRLRFLGGRSTELVE